MLIEFLKFIFLIPNALISLYQSFLKSYTFALESSYVCLDKFRTYVTKSQMLKLIAKSHNSNYGKGCRNHNRIWEYNFHNCYLLNAFPHSHFHEGGNLMTLRFYGVWVPIHVNLPKPRFATNPNSYGLNFLNLDFLPYGNTSAHHVFQVV